MRAKIESVGGFAPADTKAEVSRILPRRALRALISVAPEYAAISCLVGLIWWGIGGLLANQHANALEAAARDTTNLVHAFEENTQRVIAGADQVLLSLRAAYAQRGDGLVLTDWVKQESAPDWLTAQIAIIGPTGMSVASTASNRRVSVADREHFTVQRDSDSDQLFISRPVLGRSSGRWTVQLTRKIKREDGRFDGIVVLSIDCYQLSGFYQSLNLQQGFIELIGLDGIVRARGPIESDSIGSLVTGIPDDVLANKSGSIRIPSGRDALTIAFRRLTTYPLVVLVGFSDKSILANFRHTRVVMVWSGVATTILLVLVGSVWIRQRKRTIRSQRSLQVTLASMSQGLVMIDAGGHVRVTNGRALELLDLPKQMMAQLGDGRSKIRQEAERTLIAALRKVHETRLRDTDDVTTPILESSISAIPTGGEVQTITDVTARHMADRRIRHMALHDHLTGLGNRVFFSDEADYLLDPTGTDGQRFALLGMDLNGFKNVNDTLGHEGGDELLIEVAKRLTAAVGPGDLVARTGGDEFALLIRLDAQKSDARDGEAFAHAICAALKMPFTIAGQEIKIGASIGISHYPDDGLGRTELLRNADLALYAAKVDRTTSVRRFEPGMADFARNKLQLEEELRAAIGTDQLFLEFQPQFRTSSLAVVGFEALVRWNHPTRGRLGPDAFIPIAEETGLIVPLGRQVLEQACRVALHWPENVHIAVNLSPVQFRDPKIVQTVETVLATTGLPASRLELEVTEGVLIADEQQALLTLSELRELGVTLALDDFGTGYASLSYLRKFPFEQIKLDRSFVQAQVAEERSRHILRAVLSLSRSLHLSVVAEGVETRTQLHLLRKQGCHAVQGFLVGRPMAQRDAENMFPDWVAASMKLATSPARPENVTPL